MIRDAVTRTMVYSVDALLGKDEIFLSTVITLRENIDSCRTPFAGATPTASDCFDYELKKEEATGVRAADRCHFLLNWDPLVDWVLRERKEDLAHLVRLAQLVLVKHRDLQDISLRVVKLEVQLLVPHRVESLFVGLGLLLLRVRYPSILHLRN